MRIDYDVFKFKFYESRKGCSYNHEKACRDTAHVPPPLRLLPRLSQRMVLPIELKEMSQLIAGTKHTIVASM